LVQQVWAPVEELLGKMRGLAHPILEGEREREAHGREVRLDPHVEKD